MSLAYVAAHTLEVDTTCEYPNAPLQSYHIHVLFLQGYQKSVDKAMELQKAFMDEFKLDANDNCTFSKVDPQADRQDMCAFEAEFEPSGPFPVANFSFFIPIGWYEKAVSWIMQNRNDLDVLVHPNSGCHHHDHEKWPVWGGNKWTLNTDIFPPENPKFGNILNLL